MGQEIVLPVEVGRAPGSLPGAPLGTCTPATRRGTLGRTALVGHWSACPPLVMHARDETNVKRFSQYSLLLAARSKNYNKMITD